MRKQTSEKLGTRRNDMPELPEVETVLRTLEHQLQHPTILHCDVFWQRTIAYPDVKEFQSTIIGKRIEDYRRFGKFLIFDLGTHIWVCHLRMEGKFYVQDAQVPYDKHVHVMFTLDNGKQLRYHDTRKFGRMWLYEKAQDQRYPCFQKFGYDVFDDRLTADYLYKKVHKRKNALKVILLDQSVLCGIGNIYADEICFAMGLHPQTLIHHLRKKDFEELIIQTRRIMNRAIRSGGTTIRSYTSSLGVDGRFQLKLKVHGKKGEACSVCGTEIKKITVGGRGTSYCPACQKRK